MRGIARCLLGALLGLCACGSTATAQVPQAERAELRREYVLANTEFTILHEMGHVAFQEFDVPLFGHEEESADTFATILMILNYGVDVDPKHMDRLLMVSAEWYEEWQLLDSRDAPRSYWDEHPLSIQRFYNINCLAFGANEQMLGLLLDHPSDLLPVERGWFCDREFARARAATFWLYNRYRKPPVAPDREPSPGKRMITVTYDEPETEDVKEVYALLRSDGLAERIARRLDELIVWPHPISINFVSCGAGTEAYFNENVRGIFICAGLLTQFGRMADYQAKQDAGKLCRNLAIRRIMGDRLGCESELAGKPPAQASGSRVRTR